MFDDLQPQENKPQSGPAVAQDIFSDADPVKDKHVLKPAPFQPKAVLTAPAVASNIQQPMMAAAPGVYAEEEGNGKKFFVLGLTILVMGGVIFGLFSAFGRFGNPFAKKQTVIVDEQPVVPETSGNKQEQSNTVPPVQNNNVLTPEVSQPQTPAVPQTPVVRDSDQDGLTDEEETNVYFTNPNLTDTDEDGLFDREEIKVYKTNPLIKDTDLDGYSDGAEVKGGYNPNGAGKLYDIIKP